MLGKRTAGHEADKLLIEQINECYVAPPRQRMAARHDDDESVNAEGEGLQSLDAGRVGGHQHADVGVALRYGRSYLVTETVPPVRYRRRDWLQASRQEHPASILPAQ